MARGSFIPDPNADFLRNCFRQYYKELDFTPPDRFTRREWGFFLFGGNNMIRHTKFNSLDELKGFLATRAPAHCYCSAAYYQEPALTPMPEKQKGWLGAELIFDLDADHLKNAESMTFSEQLANVKKMVEKLLFDFLMPDFDFSEKHTELFFSGGRGYHIHITDPRVLTLDSKDRQEIVDYLTGTGLKEEWVMNKEAFDRVQSGQFYKVKSRIVMFDEDSPGWKGRIRKGAKSMVEELRSRSKEEAVQFMLYMKEDPSLKGHMSAGSAGELYDKLFHKAPDGLTAAERTLQTGHLDEISPDRFRNMFFRLILAYSRIEVAGETDEPVTKDIKRLLRMPYSLHGKTGFKVVKVELDRLEEFDPLDTPVVFSNKPMKLEVTKPVEITLKGKEYDLEPGEAEVPLHMAVFLVARKMAKVR